jgi:hypothetical protein
MIIVPKLHTRRRWFLGSAVYFPQIMTWLFREAAPVNVHGAMTPESVKAWRDAPARK